MLVEAVAGYLAGRRLFASVARWLEEDRPATGKERAFVLGKTQPVALYAARSTPREPAQSSAPRA